MGDFTDNLQPAKPTGPETLSKERSQSALPVKDLATYLLGDVFLECQDRILREVQKERLFSKATQQNLSRPDRYKLGLARGKLIRRMKDKLGWSPDELKMAEYLVDDVTPYALHMGMFVTTLREQASDDQKAFWLPKAENWQIIGAYAQTELGHGSNVKGIELEARWDPKTKDFIIHSPTLTSSKWWSGTLGRTANHAVVVAQLLLPRPRSSLNKLEYISYGPHPFCIQVRDMESHKPLPGIVIGDIGAKYGYAPMDNAYMLFDHFHVPHSAFLNRYANVNSDTGAYTKPENSAVLYGSMTYVRAQMIMHARLVLARTVTIAIRYLSIRRQFRDRDGDGQGHELAVLDYPTVQIRVLPLLATSFALHYSGKAMDDIYTSSRSSIADGNFSKLLDLHSLSSGLKSLCTILTADGIETARRALGGHGFGGGSGMIQLNNDYLSKPTVEGDNWMLTQQTAAYLIKKVDAAVRDPNGKVTNATDANIKDFLKARIDTDEDNKFDVLGTDLAIVNAFRRRAADLSLKAYEERVVKKRPWNSLLIQLHKLSTSYSQSILVENFYNALTSDESVPNLAKPVLWDLFRLFSLHTMTNEAIEFLNSGGVSNDQLNQLPGRIQTLMGSIRPHAVNLVDSWSIPDYLLDSALGRYDGKVYEDLFNRAHRLNPLMNNDTFNPNYWEEEIIKGSNDASAILAKL